MVALQVRDGISIRISILFFAKLNLTYLRNFGDKTCFLFNLRKDAKIMPSKTAASYLFQVNNSFGFGNNDLVLQSDFEKCSSELENCFTYNLPPKSEEAKNFLTGNFFFFLKRVF
jgi:hypothetical protein